MPNGESGCFPWLGRRRRAKAKKAISTPRTGAVTPTGSLVDDLNDFGSTPTKKAYAVEASRRTINIISGVVGLVGVPLVKEVLGIGLSLLTTCETINQVQEKVAELKNRVASFLLVIAKIAKDPEDNPLFKSSKGLMEELQDLKDCLASITTRLEAIRSQNVFLTTFLPDSNIRTIEECVNCFQDSIDRFQTLRGIHAAQDLTQIQSELEDIYGLTKVVVAKVENIEVEVREIKSSVDELKSMLERTGAETELYAASMEMPPVPEIFLGRDSVVLRVAEALSSGDPKRSRVCILGPGGIGKTSTALAVIDHPLVKAKFSPKNCIWVPCISLTSPGTLLAHLARRFGIASQTDPLQAMTTTLEQDDNHYIILLDNFETTWHPVEGDQALARNILRALDKLPNVAIIVTMRSEFPPLPHWQPERLDILPLQDCRQIYTTIEPLAANNEDLNFLLEAIGRLPYAVTLVATQAKYASATPTQMLAEWKAVGSEMLTDVEDCSKGIDSSIELSVKSKYVTSSAGAIDLLQVLSMLPGGVYQDELSIWIKSWRVMALSTLRNAALVMTREVVIEGVKKIHLFVLPVVQAYMRQRGRIPEPVRQGVYDACIGFLGKCKSMIDGPNDPRYKHDLPEITAQEVNVQAILTEILRELNSSETASSSTPHAPSSIQLDALLAFAFYQCWTHPRLDFAEQVLAVSRRSQSPLHEAEATYCLARQQSALWLNSVAITGMEKARDLYLGLDTPLRVKACIADCQILFCMHDADGDGWNAASLSAATASLKARWEPLFSSDQIIHGLVTFWTADLAWLMLPMESPDYATVLAQFLETRDIFIAAQRPYDLRSCDLALTRYYLKESQYEEARVCVDQALDLTAKENLPEDCFFYICKARCLKASGEWGPDLRAILREGLASAHRLGWPYEIALVLEELAEAYVRDEDWEAARLAYEEIIKQCKKAVGWSISNIRKRAEENYSYTQAKEANSDDTSVDFMIPERW